MNIFGLGKKKEESARSKCIKDLKSEFENIRRPYNDDSVYELMFQSDEQVNTLRIYITGDFPISKPVLQVTGPITHNWLDKHKRVVGSDKLNAWDKSSSLVVVIQECITAFQIGYIPPTNQPTAQLPPSYQQSAIQSTGSAMNTSSNMLPTYQHASDHQSISSNPPSYQLQSLSMSSNIGGYGQASAMSNVSLPGVDSGGNMMSAGAAPPGYYDASATKSPPWAALPPPSYSQAQISNPVMSNQQFNFTTTNRNSTTTSSPLPLPLPLPSSQQQQPAPAMKRENSSSHTTMPDIPQTFPMLNDLSEAQLERLLKDNVAMQAHVNQLEGADSMKAVRNDMRASNAALVAASLVKKSAISTATTEIRQLQGQLRQAVIDHQAAVADKSKEYVLSKDDVLRVICGQRDLLDAHTEQLASRFVSGDDRDLGPFLQEYMEKRIQYHTICAKLNSIQPQH